jgi:hypothetical protein
MSSMLHDFPELVSDSLEDQLIKKQRLNAVIKAIEDLINGVGIHKASKKDMKRNVDVFIRREIYGETYNAIGARYLLSSARISQITYRMSVKIRSMINDSHRQYNSFPYFPERKMPYRYTESDLNVVFDNYGQAKVAQVYRAWKGEVLSMSHIKRELAIERAERELDRVLSNLSVRKNERQSIINAVIYMAKGDPEMPIYHREGSRKKYYAVVLRQHTDLTSSVTHSQANTLDYLRAESRNFFMQDDVLRGQMKVYERYEYTDTPEIKEDKLKLIINYKREEQ